ncbi:MAG: DUF4920 domain-containing protein [Gammaproteobacteria bacterium]|jgi:hypothetical protein|nr:DUF4920 domain-containing protein [Gammaproteobacteria bacterium]|tara:strand:- start:94 stop:564 length:471 start_codon:yes stop_codon:yes gene_type:complete
MKLLNSLLLSLIAAFVCVAGADEPFSSDQSFGATMPHEGEAVSLKQAIASLDGGSDEFVKVKGQVTEVCQAKGCWMILVDGDIYARITFEDYGFFVPIETSMQRSLVYGVLSEHTLSGDQAKHFAQDAGAKSTLDLHGEVKEYSIVARAVQLEKRS